MKGSTRKDKVVGGRSNIAVALNYDGDNAPRVTAKGEDQLAQRILELAEENGVPLYPDPQLAATLVQIPLGDQVPEQLYLAVAEVIAFAYMVAGKVPKGFEAGEGSPENGPQAD